MGGAHLLCSPLELNTNTFYINGLLVPIPGKTLNANMGNIASQTSVSLYQQRLHTLSRGPQSSCQSTWTTSNNQHIRLCDNRDFSGKFLDMVQFMFLGSIEIRRSRVQVVTQERHRARA
jgi:hypothetical protein